MPSVGWLILVIFTKAHRTVLSDEPDTTVMPSELTATLHTEPVWPLRVDLHAPDSRSQILR